MHDGSSFFSFKVLLWILCLQSLLVLDYILDKINPLARLGGKILVQTPLWPNQWCLVRELPVFHLIHDHCRITCLKPIVQQRLPYIRRVIRSWCYIIRLRILSQSLSCVVTSGMVSCWWLHLPRSRMAWWESWLENWWEKAGHMNWEPYKLME